MTAREQAIVRMHNAGLSDAEIVAVLAMRGDTEARAVPRNPTPERAIPGMMQPSTPWPKR